MKHDELKRVMGAWSDQELMDRYSQEMLKVKMIVRWKRQGRQEKRPCGYPYTLKMNLCSRELKRRGMPLPEVKLSDETE